MRNDDSYLFSANGESDHPLSVFSVAQSKEHTFVKSVALQNYGIEGYNCQDLTTTTYTNPKALLMACEASGLVIFNIDDPENPVQIAKLT